MAVDALMRQEQATDGPATDPKQKEDAESPWLNVGAPHLFFVLGLVLLGLAGVGGPEECATPNHPYTEHDKTEVTT